MCANDETSERNLILQAKMGDSVAFTQLVHRHDRQVYSIATRFTGSPEEAKDICQEVFLRVFRGIKNFRSQSALSTWIHRITVNVCLSRRRRPRNISLLSIERRAEEREPGVDIPDEDTRTDGQLLNRELSDRINLALQTLPPRQRLVFTMRHYQGEQLKEIASAMKCSEGTVKRYLFNATRRMREQLEDLL